MMLPPPSLIRPEEKKAQLGPVGRTAAINQVLEIPGVRVVQDAEGYDHLELPRSTWTLDAVSAVCVEHGVSTPSWVVPTPLVHVPMLRDYQVDGVSWLLQMRGGILGDVMGAGKTIQAATACEILYESTPRPILIVGPKYLRQTWREELLKIGAIEDPDRQFCALEGRTLDPAKWKDAKYYYCHYDVIEAWWPQLWRLRPPAVIVDEAHFVKNSRTRRAKGVSHAASLSPVRILLTGTSILNRLGEMWNLLNLAEGSFHFGKPLSFRRRYAGAFHTGFGWQDGDLTREDELRERFRWCYLGRRLHEISLKLPPFERSVVSVPFTPRYARRYREVLQGFDPRVIARMLRNGVMGAETLKLLGRVRKITSQVKVEATVDLAVSLRMEGASTVVFTWERAMAEKIGKALNTDERPVYVTHGGIPQDKRDAMVAAFQEHGGIIVATIDSLSVGVNLQRARAVIMHDLDWTPAKILQAEARVWRGGQTQPVMSRWVVVEDSLDQLLARHLAQKQDLIQRVFQQEDQGLVALLDDADFESEIAEHMAQWRAWREGAA